MIPDRARSPRLQAGLLAFVLPAGVAKVLAYDAAPGVAVRDVADVTAAARARGTARLVVRITTKSGHRSGARTTGEGVASFRDGRSRVTVSMPGVVTRLGAAPEYEVRAGGGRGYVRPLGAPGWASFDEADDVAPGTPTASSLLAAMERHGTIRRGGGGTVRDVGCDRYDAPAADADGWGFAMWVDRDGLPRRVEWTTRMGDLTGTYRIELYDWGTAADVEIPAEARHVGTALDALTVVGLE